MSCTIASFPWKRAFNVGFAWHVILPATVIRHCSTVKVGAFGCGCEEFLLAAEIAKQRDADFLLGTAHLRQCVSEIGEADTLSARFYRCGCCQNHDIQHVASAQAEALAGKRFWCHVS